MAYYDDHFIYATAINVNCINYRNNMTIYLKAKYNKFRGKNIDLLEKHAAYDLLFIKETVLSTVAKSFLVFPNLMYILPF